LRSIAFASGARDAHTNRRFLRTFRVEPGKKPKPTLLVDGEAKHCQGKHTQE
jgi:hypothetical protein